jgi:sulfur-oxidizing protein SoxZ
MIHPMETGLSHDESGKVIAAHYITDVQVRLAGRPIFAATLGRGVSRDPLLHFRISGGTPGERISVAWTDNHGERREDDAVLLSA